MDAATTSYTLDLNNGLTQVLTDGTDTYLYGNGRIAEKDTAWNYYQTDALGSIRQLTDPTAHHPVKPLKFPSSYNQIPQIVLSSQ